MYDLLSKYLAGDISAEERRIFFQQLEENEEFRKEAAGIQNLSALVSMASEDGVASDLQYRSFIGMRKRRALLFSMRKVAGYAAIVLFSVLSTYLLMNYAGNKEEEFVRYQEFSTPAGQRAKVLLADGTEVWLNANSTLRYPERFDPKKEGGRIAWRSLFRSGKSSRESFRGQDKQNGHSGHRDEVQCECLRYGRVFRRFTG